MKIRTGILLIVLFFTRNGWAQLKPYPQNYFRNPLNIPMQLVANFGEIRANHWHMGLDIRTQQKVNLPVYAAAEGYIARISVEPGGFGQAIYINHPNGYTTLYAHLNSFFPALASYVKQQQYEKESWAVNLILPPGMFPVKKGDFIALSGSTGGSAGPHVHFEIRNTATENVLNPLLFKFPIPDGVPPTISRLVMYDRKRSTYEQSPQPLALRRSGSVYTVNPIRVGSNRISFALGATDRFTGSSNPNGIYSAKMLMDGKEISGFTLDDISYNDTRYLNAQVDLLYKSRGGGDVQHITPLPGAHNISYAVSENEGVLYLPDNEVHQIEIEVRDAGFNRSLIRFSVQYDPSLARSYAIVAERLLPNHVNIIEKEDFELYTTENSIYDTVAVSFSVSQNRAAHSISPVFSFLQPAIPVHDSVTVRLKLDAFPEELKDRIVIKNISGSRTIVQKATVANGWATARFRQFGTYQAFLDTIPPVFSTPSMNLAKATRLVFTPTDNFGSIRSFRAEVDGQWLRFTNDKGRTWIYSFDEKFPGGDHELTVMVEDEAGNVTTRRWNVKR